MRELRTVLHPTRANGSSQAAFGCQATPDLNAVARVSAATDARRIISWTAGASAGRRIDGESLYRLAQLAGLDYGPRFRTVSHVEITDELSAIAYLDPPPSGEALDSYLLHPALLDGALQALFGLLTDRQHQIQGVGFLPWRFGRVRLPAPYGRIPRRALLRLTRTGVRSVSADIVLSDGAGDIVAELADCWFRRVELTRQRSVDERALRIDLVPAALSQTGSPRTPYNLSATLSRLGAAHEPPQARQDQALLLDALVGAVALRSLSRLVEPGRPFTIGELSESGQIAPGSVALTEACCACSNDLAQPAKPRRNGSSHRRTIYPRWGCLAAAPCRVARSGIGTRPRSERGGGSCRSFSSTAQAAGCSTFPMVEHLLGVRQRAIGITLLCAALENSPSRGRSIGHCAFSNSGRARRGDRRILNLLTRSKVAFAYLQPALIPSMPAVWARSPSPTSASQPTSGHRETETRLWARCDIVLAVNACARLQLDRACLASLRDLLVPGGLLLALEPEPNALWDLVFGQNASWWQTLAGRRFIAAAHPRGLANRPDRSGLRARRIGANRNGAVAQRRVLGWRAAPFGASARRSSLVCRAHSRQRRRCFRRDPAGSRRRLGASR